MFLNIPYNNRNGAATIVATPIPIRPRKNIKIINDKEYIVIVKPSSKFKGMINNPIAENENSNSHKLSKLHLSFQYTNDIIKQPRIKSRYVIITNFVSA